MNEIKLKFKNYKLLKDVEFNLSGGSIFFIQAKNNSGKTTLLNAIAALMEVKDNTVNPVSFGEKEGHVIGTIPGADGKDYQIRYDFNVDGDKKFVVIGPDNRKISKVGDMRNVFNYTHFTVDEFFSWSMDAKGRAKQKQIILELLSESERETIAKIDAAINGVTGTIFTSRQNINREIDGLKLIVDRGTNFTEEEKKLVSQKKDIEVLLETLGNKYEEAMTFINNSSSSATIVEMAQKNYDDEVLSFEKATSKYNEDAADINRQIKELQEKLDKMVVEHNNNEVQHKINLKELDAKLKKAKEGVDVQKLAAYKADIEDVFDDEGKCTKQGLKSRIAKGNELIDAITKLELRKEQYDKSVDEYDKKKKESDELTTQIETLRKERTNVLKNSERIPSGISVDDDYISVDGIPFVETDLCKSSATKAIAKLMMEVNDSPIMLMGDAEHLGYEILDELNEAAEANGKIMIFAEHVRDAEDLHVVCYDELEHEKKPGTPKEIF